MGEQPSGTFLSLLQPGGPWTCGGPGTGDILPLGPAPVGRGRTGGGGPAGGPQSLGRGPRSWDPGTEAGWWGLGGWCRLCRCFAPEVGVGGGVVVEEDVKEKVELVVDEEMNQVISQRIA